MRYRIGIDVGERSVGLAAVEYDDAGFPLSILSAVSHIHDGGKDPTTGKTPQSRLSTAGVARRARRLIRNRHRRLAELDRVLRDLGFPVPEDEVAQTHDAWLARAELSRKFVEDQTVRKERLSLAIRHMARHRGWRSPWWSVAQLDYAPTPSEPLKRMFTNAAERFGECVGDCNTLGQLVSAVAAGGTAIRPTKRALPNGEFGPLISAQVRQEDTLAELRLILETQEIPSDAGTLISAAMFEQTKARVPRERIGHCALITDELRAPNATLEFQEYRVRSAVANLRIGHSKRSLTDDEHDLVVERLLGWRNEDSPRWSDVAEWLNINTRDLAKPSIDDSGGTRAPTDRTSTTIELSLKEKSEIRRWWDAADPDDRAEFIDHISDLSGVDLETTSASLSEFMARWDDQTEKELEKLDLSSGRAAYSRAALRRLNDVMAAQRCDVHSARKIAFGVNDDWQPPRPTFADPIEHPTVRRVSTLVHRYLSTAELKWGLPETIVIEHVRTAFMGPETLAAYKDEVAANTKRREKIKKELEQQGIVGATDTDVRRSECIERQNSQCLYCGTEIGIKDSELDHIVARAIGGGNRNDNLVAVCHTCNKDKWKIPFATWAANSNKPGVSLAEAKSRVRGWERGRLTVTQMKRLKRNVTNRLALTSDDNGSDRSIQSTAYAAREMRFRIESFLGIPVEKHKSDNPRVLVFQGAVTSEARKAGGVDGILQLRGFTKKSRFDRRHHAVDAAVITTLDASVGRTLKERAALAETNRLTGHEPDWKSYEGRAPDIYREWKLRVLVLAELLVKAVQDDRIAVMRPLRLVPHVGAVHADTIESLKSRSLSDAFSADELLRVADPKVLERLLAIANEDGGLEPSVGRATALGLPTEVHLFPSNAPYIPVRRGAAAIGVTAQYARIYAWRTKAGFGYGVVRMFTGEFARIGFHKPGIDVLHDPLPETSQAVLTANPTLRQRIRSGEAKQIGWIALGDEIEIDVEGLGGDSGKMAEFLAAIPERRWVVTGFFDPMRISIAPALLAAEGVDSDTPSVVSKVLADNRIPIAVNVVLAGKGVTVIRRTVLGTPRWNHSSLPISWQPRAAAEAVLGQ